MPFIILFAECFLPVVAVYRVVLPLRFQKRVSLNPPLFEYSVTSPRTLLSHPLFLPGGGGAPLAASIHPNEGFYWLQGSRGKNFSLPFRHAVCEEQLKVFPLLSYPAPVTEFV